LPVTIKGITAIRGITTFAAHIAFFITKGLRLITREGAKAAKTIGCAIFNAIAKGVIEAIRIFETSNAALGGFDTNGGGATARRGARNALVLCGADLFTIAISGVITVIGKTTF
jgi:hypothetical protein